MTLAVSGKIPTTLVRRFNSRFCRSIGLFDEILDQCAGGFSWAFSDSSPLSRFASEAL